MIRFFHLLARLAAALPEGLAVRLGSGYGWLLWRVFRFRRQIVDGQIRAALPELSLAQHRDLVRRVYRHFGLLALGLHRSAATRPGHQQGRPAL